MCWRSSVVASSRLIPTGAVISGIGVITSSTLVVAHSATGVNRRSRLVMIPSRRASVSTTGRPETRYSPQMWSSSSSVLSGPMVTGLEIIPVWVRLTRSTW